MKPLFVIVFCAFFLTNHLQACAQTPSPSSQPSAWAGLENALAKPNPALINLNDQPVLIEKDMASDRDFAKALEWFDEKNTTQAAQLIRSGAQALLNEAPVDAKSPNRKLVEQRVGELYGLAMRVESGNVHDRETLQSSFADAEESVAHRYYTLTNTLIGAPPETFASQLMGLSVHLTNSKKYHVPAETAQVERVANEAADLALRIRQMKEDQRELTPELKADLNRLLLDVKALKLEE